MPGPGSALTLRTPAPIERLPTEIQFEILQHLLYLTPSPVGRISEEFKRGYHVRIFSREKEPKPAWMTLALHPPPPRYLHPFVSLKVSSKILNAAVEAFCKHLLDSKNFGVHEPIRSGTMRSRQTNTFHFLEMLWTQCAYCNKKSKKKGIITTYLHLCSTCDRKHFPKLTETDAKKLHKLTAIELEDPRNRIRKGYYMVHGTSTKMYLERDIARYVVERAKPGRVMLPGETDEDKAACLRALHDGLLANGLKPVIRGIGHPDLSLHEYDPAKHTPLLKTRTVAEVVRLQVLYNRIMTETVFPTHIWEWVDRFGVIEDRSACYSQHFRRTDGNPAIRGIDVFNLGLYLLFLKEFGTYSVPIVSDPTTLLNAYKNANRYPFEDSPWHLMKYPVFFRQPPIPPDVKPKYHHLYYTLYPCEKPLIEAKKGLVEELERAAREGLGRNVNPSHNRKLEKWMKSGSW